MCVLEKIKVLQTLIMLRNCESNSLLEPLSSRDTIGTNEFDVYANKIPVENVLVVEAPPSVDGQLPVIFCFMKNDPGRRHRELYVLA